MERNKTAKVSLAGTFIPLKFREFLEKQNARNIVLVHREGDGNETSG